MIITISFSSFIMVIHQSDGKSPFLKPLFILFSLRRGYINLEKCKITFNDTGDLSWLEDNAGFKVFFSDEPF